VTNGSLDLYGRPLVSLQVRGPFGSRTISVIVDTAFTSNLTIPRSVVVSLGLSYVSVIYSERSDGSYFSAKTCDCQILWEGVWQDLEAVESPNEASLMGARLLHRRRLHVDYGPAQSVEIE
jgi:predicted aspartyl protease